jgi:hypothetical protein
MRPRFASGVLFVVLAAVPAAGFDRHDLEPGDTAIGDISLVRTFDEYTMHIARGSSISMSLAKVSGAYKPQPGLYTDDYYPIELVGTSAARVMTLSPLAESKQVRIIVGSAGGGVGAYRLKTSVKPAKLFSMSATSAAPANTLAFAAYPGFDFTVTLKWKGTGPVTLKDAQIAGPPGAPALTSVEDAVPRGASSTQKGFRTTAWGEHTITLDVPPGTLAWSASVKLSGQLPGGTVHDFRTQGPPQPPQVLFPSPGQFPIATVAGELGGPNNCLLSASGANPDGAFLDGGNACQRAPIGPGPAFGRYVLACVDGYVVTIESVQRYPDGGPFGGLVASYEAPIIRSPQGTGWAKLWSLEYADGRPTGWIEDRHFDASGRGHRLVFSRAEYFPNGYCKAFHVTHQPLRSEDGLPDGPVTEYDYAPFR